MLSAYTGNDAGSDGIGAHLAGKIDLNCGIDGHYLRVLRDAERVVRPCNILQQQVLAVVHIIVEPARAEGQRGHRDAWKDFFAGIIYHSAFKERKDAVGHGLGVEAEVAVVLQG